MKRRVKRNYRKIKTSKSLKGHGKIDYKAEIIKQLMIQEKHQEKIVKR